MKKNHPKLSVVINTKNAAETLARSIESVQWADEILVADMHSLDETVKIARKYGTKIIELPEYGRVEPEGRNLANQAATGDWLLQLDADEVVPRQLAEMIEKVVGQADQIQTYFIPRKNLIFGHWIQHSGWWPDYQPRLFQKGSLRWVGGVHSKPQLKGATEKIEAKEGLAIIHNNYHSISDYIDRLNRYTSLGATESLEKSLSADDNYTQVFSSELFSRYFYHQGWLDGEIGLLLAYLQSFSQLVQLAKTRELNGKLNQKTKVMQEAELRKLITDLRYWLADYHVKNETMLMRKLYWRIRRRVSRYL